MEAISQLPFVFVAGLLGSSHCLGMCGPFAVGVGSGALSTWDNLRRQSLFSAGRIFTYGALGATAGFCGLRVTRALPVATSVPAILAVVAGLWMLYVGLGATGLLPQRRGGRNAAVTGCLVGAWFAPFLRPTPSGGSLVGRGAGYFLAGMFTGWLPCGLVYAFSALAASSTSLLLGAATMVIFGLGTMPLMVLAGLGGSLLRWESRQRLLRVAAWCVVLSGSLSLARGIMALGSVASTDSPACPFCPPPSAQVSP